MLKVIAIIKSIGWNIFGIALGLFQLILSWLYSSLGNEVLCFDKVLMDGVILFFCSAFVFASVIEYICTKEQYPKPFISLFFFALPIVMMGLIIVLYFAIIGFGEKINMDSLSSGTSVCFIIAVLHSVVFRSLRNYSEMRE